ncbi:hypothetical protein [Arundinibacter roseus]|uniref:Uncharacterized protein n=1 Tax=Arundinibacter roseus TaxID=2070510 RepID=A0A4V2XAV2_9BACT|nr:hypothetical protein [Arundinibacter roseus]TDB69015.1 hypothetical protein EZE20_01390 [Arundinibacter roseus]
MKALKVLFVLILISVQANATGYSHNMLVAQKMLKTKKAVKKSEVKTESLQLKTTPTVVKQTACPTSQESEREEVSLRPDTSAASFSQYIARWIVRILTINGQVLGERLVSLFSTSDEVEKELPTHASFVGVTGNILSYINTPMRKLL